MRPAAWAALALLAGGRGPGWPQAALPGAPYQSVRIVLLGDTGEPGARIGLVRMAVMAEEKDLVVALGDLIYPQAPSCPEGRLAPATLALLDEAIGQALEGLGAPVLLLRGNHDVPDLAGADCLVPYAATRPDLILPALAYTTDLGVATLVALDTNSLDNATAKMAAAAFAQTEGWRIVLGHHVLKAYGDKGSSTRVAKWLARHGLKPDFYASGDAHLLQFGVYGGVPAAISGTASRVRERPACPPTCGTGELWGVSEAGYAVMEIAGDTLEVTFKDANGATLWRHRLNRPAAAG